MSLQTLSAWTRCPNCSEDLSPAPDAGPLALGCPNGHRFDANRRGYVSLLPPRSAVHGDTPAMLDERDALLSSGAYAPIASALVDATRTHLADGAPCWKQTSRHAEPTVPEGGVSSELLPAGQELGGGAGAGAIVRVMDSGCGTGYYLHAVLDALTAAGAAARGLASDLSPAAVQRAVRGRDDVDGLVADIWSPLPVRDASADVLMAVFAPRNPTEFARVLSPDGALLIVVPRAEHLAELRASADMLDVPDGKAESLERELDGLFELADAHHLGYELPLTLERAAQLIGMGPSAHHRASTAALEEGRLPASVTVSVDMLRFAKRPREET